MSANEQNDRNGSEVARAAFSSQKEQERLFRSADWVEWGWSTSSTLWTLKQLKAMATAYDKTCKREMNRIKIVEALSHGLLNWLRVDVSSMKLLFFSHFFFVLAAQRYDCICVSFSISDCECVVYKHGEIAFAHRFSHFLLFSSLSVNGKSIIRV